MDRVLNTLYYQCCTTIIQRTNYRSRSIVEQLLLIIAVCGYGAVLLSHSTFVVIHQRYYSTTSSSIAPTTIVSNLTTNNSSYNTNNHHHHHPRKNSIPLTCLASIDGFNIDADLTHVVILNDRRSILTTNSNSNKYTTTTKTSSQRSSFIIHKSNKRKDTQKQKEQQQQEFHQCIDNDDSFNDCSIHRSTSHRQLQLLNSTIVRPLTTTPTIKYTYSKIESYVYMTQSLRRKHNINEQYVFISTTDTYCFGEPFVQFLVFNIIGPETVIINWLLGLEQLQRQRQRQHQRQQDEDEQQYDNDNYNSGFIYNPRSGNIIDLGAGRQDDNRNPSTTTTTTTTTTSIIISTILQQIIIKFWIVIKTLFLFGITTTLVNFTLHSTQQLMFNFTYQLQVSVRSRQPIAILVIRHLIESLVFVPIMVGTMFFLIEIYNNDKFLGFIVLSLIWISEVFTVVGLRTKQASFFFPRIFFLLFALFHFYYFSFPFGFSYSAFGTLLVSVLHTMVFFIHRFEIPAVITTRQQQQMQQQQQQQQQIHPGQNSIVVHNDTNQQRGIVATTNNNGNQSSSSHPSDVPHTSLSDASTTQSGLPLPPQQQQQEQQFTRRNVSSSSFISTTSSSVAYRQSLLLQLNDDNSNIGTNNHPISTSPSVSNLLRPRQPMSSFNLHRWRSNNTSFNDNDDDDDNYPAGTSDTRVDSCDSVFDNTNGEHQLDDNYNDDDDYGIFEDDTTLSDRLVLDYRYDGVDIDDDYDNDDNTATASSPSTVSVSNRTMMLMTNTNTTTTMSSSDYELDPVTNNNSTNIGNGNSSYEMYRSSSFFRDNETSTLQSILFSSRDSFFSQQGSDSISNNNNNNSQRTVT